MNISTSHPSDTVVKITISGSAKELLHAKQKALVKLSSQVKVQGFRQGHTPPAIVEKNVQPNVLQQEVIDEVLNDLYSTALQKENIRPVSRPKIELMKFVPYSDIEFTVEFDVVGKITLGDYKKLSVTKKTSTVETKDVNEVIKRLRAQMAEYKEEDRVAKDGDRVWIDFVGKDEKGTEVQGAKGQDYPLVLGSNTFIPGFEENVIGIKKDESKTFTIVFPKEYGVKALQGKKVTFTITAKKVESVLLPKVDDEFAKKAGPFKTVDELKKDIHKQIEVERKQQVERKHQDDLIKELIKKSTLSLPASMLEEQIIAVDRDFKQNLIYRGQTFQEYLDSNNTTEEEYKTNELQHLAEERLKAGLVLSEVADKENITITPEELEIRLQVLKGQYKDEKMQKELETPEARRDVAARLLTEKTIQKIVDYNTK